MADLNKLETTWERYTWDVSSRLDSTFLNIKQWGDLYYTDTIIPKVLITFADGKCKIEVSDNKIYTGTDFPPPDMKEKIISAIEEDYLVNGDRYEYLMLDQEYELLAGRVSYKESWEYNGSLIDDKNWDHLSFTTFYNWYKQNLNKDSIVIRVGPYLWRVSNIYYEKILALIVLHDYCDKYIPKRDGEVKVVSFEGFSTIVAFLKQVLGTTKRLNTSTLRSLYEDINKANLLPIIPVRWKEDDLELMNTRRLDLVVKEIDKELEKKEDDAKKEEKSSTTNSQKNSQKQSGTPSTTKNTLLQSARDIIEKQIGLADRDSVKKNTLDIEYPIKLSELFSHKNLLTTDIWGNEYMVDIDTNITEGGISLAENEMLIAIISYGLLEILVEEHVSTDLLDELSIKLEEKYGLGVDLISLSEKSAKTLLEKGRQLNVGNES